MDVSFFLYVSRVSLYISYIGRRLDECGLNPFVQSDVCKHIKPEDSLAEQEQSESNYKSFKEN